jgi:prophage maintenance system killer protein
MDAVAPMSEVELYQSADGSVSLHVKSDGDTVWLTQEQIASLFGRERSVISRHISNAEREELAGIPTRAKYAQVQVEAGRRVERSIEHFNLDVITSVGYRVKSTEGVRFRRWANDVLKRYLVAGVARNESRLRDIALMTQILERSADTAVSGIASLLARYAPGLTLLEQYDRDALPEPSGTTPAYRLSYSDARAVIDQLAVNFPDDDLLGNERGEAFRGAIESIDQTFMGQELYPTVQAKAAHLLYFVTKDHPFSDGNKRSAAALFTYYLSRNDALAFPDGRELVPSNMLTALTLMVANSEPREKETVIRLITNLIDLTDHTAE